jgi:anti-sigma factor ChrR (cupin superfamily)
MITEQQQEQAALYALGALDAEEEAQFTAELRVNRELREFLTSLQRTTDKLAVTGHTLLPPASLKEKILLRLQGKQAAPAPKLSKEIPPYLAGLKFVMGDETTGWKQLPVSGAWLKLLSFEPTRGYAVLLGKLEPGARYPAHSNAGPEDFYILTGDLHVGERVLVAGDFHHADKGSFHEENVSVGGCTLLAVLTVDDPLVAFARE